MSGFNLSERYAMMLNLSLGALMLYFLALGVSDVFKLHYAPTVVPAATQYTNSERPQLAGVHPRQYYDVIAHRDIFNLTPLETAPVENEHLDATLIGTSQVTTGKPYAIIENSGSQAVYRVGDMVPGAGQLLSVTRDRVVILHDGHRVALELPEQGLTPRRPSVIPAPGPLRRLPPRRPQSLAGTSPPGGVHQVAPNQYVLDRSTVDSNLKNMAPLFTEIRATPQLENGVASGFLLTEIQPNSIFQQIGLQDGDVLQSVNGQGVGDPAKAFNLLQSLQGQSVITLNVIRNGATQQVSYHIH